jgi:hypothetical protein
MFVFLFDFLRWVPFRQTILNCCGQHKKDRGQGEEKAMRRYAALAALVLMCFFFMASAQSVRQRIPSPQRLVFLNSGHKL